MKNIHLLPTEVLSTNKGYILGKCIKEMSDVKIGQFVIIYYLVFDKEYFQPYHIYITSNEKIEIGDYYPLYGEFSNKIVSFKQWDGKSLLSANQLKVIITNDRHLIFGGTQDIDIEFLEWFVENPTYIYVETDYVPYGGFYNINIDTSKKEPKQETLEEEKLIHSLFVSETEEELLREFEGESDEEINQETLEESATNYGNDIGNTDGTARFDFIRGAKSDAARNYWFTIFKQELKL